MSGSEYEKPIMIDINNNNWVGKGQCTDGSNTDICCNPTGGITTKSCTRGNHADMGCSVGAAAVADCVVGSVD